MEYCTTSGSVNDIIFQLKESIVSLCRAIDQTKADFKKRNRIAELNRILEYDPIVANTWKVIFEMESAASVSNIAKFYELSNKLVALSNLIKEDSTEILEGIKSNTQVVRRPEEIN